MGKRVVLVDVDGTVANLTEAFYNYLKGKGMVSWKNRLYYRFYKLLRRLGVPVKAKGGSRKGYEILGRLLREGKKEELKRIVEQSLFPDAVEKLRELAQRKDVEVYLLSGSLHPLVKLLVEVLQEKGIPLKGVGRHPTALLDKGELFEVGIVPVEKGAKVVVLDNRENRSSWRNKDVLYVEMEDRWLGTRGKKWKDIRWEELL